MARGRLPTRSERRTIRLSRSRHGTDCVSSLNLVVVVAHELQMNFQKRAHSTAEKPKKDKVEAAFHKYDSNNDGYLNKEEFSLVSSI